MTDDQTLYTFSFNLEDSRRIVYALRGVAYQISQESERACEKGANDYGEILWQETAILNAIAADIDFILPE